jgi:hypothetical protein
VYLDAPVRSLIQLQNGGRENYHGQSATCCPGSLNDSMIQSWVLGFRVFRVYGDDEGSGQRHSLLVSVHFMERRDLVKNLVGIYR